MGVTLTDVLLFGKAQLEDVDKATLVIYRRNILRWSALGGYLDIIVKGVAPLSLPDAIADSLSYVKAFGGTEQRNLPDNYTQVEYIQSNATQYIVTSFVPTYDLNYRFKMKTLASLDVAGAFLSARNSSDVGGGFSFGTNASNQLVADFFQTGARWTDSSIQFQPNAEYEYIVENKVATLKANGVVIGTHTFEGTGTTNQPIWLFAFNNGGTIISSTNKSIQFELFEAWDNTGYKCRLFPAKNSSNVFGVYDTVANAFLQKAIGDDFVAGPEAVPTPDAPMDIVSNNGVLTLSPNMTNYGDSSWKDGYFTTSGAIGLANPEQGEMYCETYYPVTAGDSYTLSFNYGGDTLPSNTWACFAFYDSDKNFISRSANSQSIAHNPKTYTTTIQSGCSYIRISLRTYKSTDNKVYNVQLEKGSSATTYHPYGVYADGTVETLLVSPNAFVSPNTIESGGISSTDGSNTNANTRLRTSDYIPVNPSTTYKFIVRGSEEMQVYVCYYSASSGSFTDNYIGGSGFQSSDIEIPLGANVRGVRCIFRKRYHQSETMTTSDITSFVVCEPSDVTTATAEMLLKVGDYQDVQSIIDGVVTRNVGVKVLDGTENWTMYNSGAYFNMSPYAADSTTVAYCSHYKYAGHGISIADMNNNEFAFGTNNHNVSFKSSQTTSTLSAWTTWLAAQYAAGTPVIIVYPLATPTTESVTGQTLQVQDGDNTLEITQASMSGLELEAKYQAAVSLTIQEVQDANLDPNVEVTIN